MTPECGFCHHAVAVGSTETMRVVVGFEEPRTAGGANMIHLRTPLDKYAHTSCVQEAKKHHRSRMRALAPQLDLTRLFRA